MLDAATGTVFAICTSSWGPFTDISYVAKVRDALNVPVYGDQVADSHGPLTLTLRDLDGHATVMGVAQ